MSARTALKNTFWRIPAAGVFLMLIVICLTFLGLVVLFSVSQQYTNPTTLLQRQVIWLVIASLAGAFTMFINLNALRPLMPFIAGVSVFMLMLVMVPGIGVKVNGAQRWIDLGPMRLQASEIGKLGLLFVMAHYLAANRRFFDQFVRGYVAPCSILAVYCGLIIIEPDFGTAFLCGLVGGCMLFLAGVRLRFLIPTAVAAITLFAVAIYHDPVRLKRITSFLDVEGNRNDSAYQLWQGILAFGAGGLHGVGLGEGRQQMSFLPEAHTDFIFAIVGEEGGLFFTCGVVMLFMTIFFIGVMQLRRAPDLYQYLLVMGALLFITFQALINIGVVTGCLPTKGMSLPFISYGGSNLVLMFTLIGIILNGFRSWELTTLRRQREL
ncbi:FtsW/RodA/SpoVE family cell cycle protein [Coraliomargarita akajimensis]|uniref:Probable peptidoglycan glycosyltransferase FtsW n=1 Tax=Coraliomargarita akajimensis (strain DSM 45221 / IAM 15411 / JCM 23193 / KCTC 12865 / 04OKA010-24) TaxID=583355 RepID=D5EI44_CORAD|nr:putative peptidoglycan glycosyltransferase FtsW [Coraliomargarita akajimensis]ADE56084.1 cell cycle protein [Coraliomargarita akajimensis DSM 45221]